MLTMRGKYGLKAALYLAALAEGELAQSSEIAERQDIPKKFLDAILGDLRMAGFVTTRKGRYGGYALQRPAAEIMAGHLIRVLDGPLAPIPCARRSGYVPCQDCPDESRCAVRLLMLEVRDAIVGVLDTRSLASVLAMAGGDSPAQADQVVAQLNDLLAG